MKRSTAVGAGLVLLLALGGLLSACDAIIPQRSEGERLYRRLCSKCHGLDGRGNTVRYMGNASADLTDDYWKHGGDRTSIEIAIREGIFGEMPDNPDMTWPEIKAILEHLDELRKQARSSPDS